MRDGLWATTAIALALGGSASAADMQDAAPVETSKPAVSGLNAKLELGYLYLNVDGFDSGSGAYGIGSVSAPLGERFGVQVDAGYARVNTNPDMSVGGVAVHGFWRDPDKALLGAYAHYARANIGFGNANSVRLGGEAELYLDRVSIEGFAGADIVSRPGNDDTSFAGNLTAAFYATDNFRIDAGVSHSFDQTFGKIGAEAMLPFAANNVSLFGAARFANDVQDYRVGLKVYFGESGKSLKARHREDDPKEQLLDFFEHGAAPAGAPATGCECGYVPCGEGCVPFPT